MLSSPRNEKGFTLIELLTVVSMLGLLLTLIIPRLPAVKHYAYSDMVASSMRRLVQQEEAYHFKFGTYTDELDNEDLAWVADRMVDVEFTLINPYSWMATGQHLGFEGAACGIAIGMVIPAGYTDGKIECQEVDGST